MDERRHVDSVEDFTRLLAQSGLVSEQRISDLVARFHEEHLPSSKLPDTVTLFCNFVASTGKVTAWQCQKLREGRWKGVFDLTGFVMLDNLGPDTQFCYFLAKDLDDGSIVRIAVTPNSWTKEHGFEFRVDHRYDQAG